jgi:hypothetical protein
LGFYFGNGFDDLERDLGDDATCRFLPSILIFNAQAGEQVLFRFLFLGLTINSVPQTTQVLLSGYFWIPF